MSAPAHTPIGEVAPACIDVPAGDRAAVGATPLVALHGWTGSKEDFVDVVEPLGAVRRVVVPDLPGHGSCPPPSDDDWGLAAHARWVLGLLDAMDLGEVHLLGHSHGGLVAQRVAYLASERLRSLTLLGTGLGALGDDARAMVERVAATARDRGMDAAWAVLGGEAGEGAGGGAVDGRDALVRERFLAMSPDAVVGVGRNLITAMPLGAFLHGIDIPVLVCHGEGDRTWRPREQRMLADRIPTARYAVVPDALHSPATENPTGLLDVLVPFLAAADGAGPGEQPTT
ncbi:alpha/beta fold hydrolase [Euzebya sp.]|uniref:alpha/beta fold hydrolase n=1 Tax=Euzebya sp. TaxID=1971409 RepID=UPI00351117D4